MAEPLPAEGASGAGCVHGGCMGARECECERLTEYEYLQIHIHLNIIIRKDNINS